MDNWIHRSKNMCCGGCMWWVPKAMDKPTAVGDRELGRCRMHAPTLKGWPATFNNDWCADHKLDENKIGGE